MPLYEYVCAQCDHAFEALVTGQRSAVCPKCGSTELAKQWSTFAASSSSPKSDMGGGHCCSGPGCCGGGGGMPGMCGLN